MIHTLESNRGKQAAGTARTPRLTIAMPDRQNGAQPTSRHCGQCRVWPAAEWRRRTSLLTSQKTFPRELVSILDRNPITRLHFRDPLSNGITVLLAAQSFHCLAMRLA